MHNRDHSLAVQSVSMPMSFQQPVRPSFAVFAHSTGQTVNSQLGSKASNRRNRPQSVTSRLEITLPNSLRHERPKLPRSKIPISTLPTPNWRHLLLHSMYIMEISTPTFSKLSTSVSLFPWPPIPVIGVTVALKEWNFPEK